MDHGQIPVSVEAQFRQCESIPRYGTVIKRRQVMNGDYTKLHGTTIETRMAVLMLYCPFVTKFHLALRRHIPLPV